MEGSETQTASSGAVHIVYALTFRDLSGHGNRDQERVRGSTSQMPFPVTAATMRPSASGEIFSIVSVSDQSAGNFT